MHDYGTPGNGLFEPVCVRVCVRVRVRVVCVGLLMRMQRDIGVIRLLILLRT